MVTVITTSISDETLQLLSEDLHGYIKVVVDIEKNVLTAGGTRHVEGEQVLLASGSKQENLWGGGLDMETLEIDFDSMINIRPLQGNTSREVLQEPVRNKMVEVIRKLLR
jgi:hypothetical protein